MEARCEKINVLSGPSKEMAGLKKMMNSVFSKGGKGGGELHPFFEAPHSLFSLPYPLFYTPS